MLGRHWPLALVHRGNGHFQRCVFRSLRYKPLPSIEDRHLAVGRGAALSYGEGAVGCGPEEVVNGLHLADEREVLEVLAHHALSR